MCVRVCVCVCVCVCVVVWVCACACVNVCMWVGVPVCMCVCSIVQIGHCSTYLEVHANYRYVVMTSLPYLTVLIPHPPKINILLDPAPQE